MHLWDHAEENDWAAAHRAASREVRVHPRSAVDLFNRGLMALALGQHRPALRDFQKANDLSRDNDGYPTFVGVALWHLNKRLESIDVWRNAIECSYTDAAGGVEVPALLFFAGIMLDLEDVVQESKKLLKKRWKPHLNRSWPGAIAGFLLGMLNQSAFLIDQTFSDPVLEARRRCQAHFWVAVMEYFAGNHRAYVSPQSNLE